MMLGPVLLLVYIIKALPSYVDRSVGLFANDTLIYQMVGNTAGEERFQVNLESLHTWTKMWKMGFNAKKCKITAFQPQEGFSAYILGNVLLKHTHHCKYFRVILQSHST